MTNIEPQYPAFDTAKPTDAERIAALEARVAALEARVNAKRGDNDAWKPLSELYDFEPGAESGTLSLKPKQK